MERRERSLAVAIASLLVLGATTAIVRSDVSSSAGPGDWDPRVVELADFVERARGLRFHHPVHVDFLTPADYTDATTIATGDLGDDDRDELAEQAALLRALGVASGPVDLAEALNQVSDGGTLAFYDPEDRRIRVRGTTLSVGLRVTLVHELTHALQDQHFALGQFLGDSRDDGEETARRALAEGDATRIEDDYVLQVLTDDEQAAYEAEFEDQLEQSEASTGGVPDFLSASFGVPYALGPPFVTMLLNDDGNRSVDDAFDEPPSTEEHLFDPASYLLEERADPPSLGLDDAEDQGPLGSPNWFLVLAQRVDPDQAFEATLGWAGDRFASYEKDGRTCVRAVFRGDTEEDEEQMEAALDAWVAAMPAGAATRIEVRRHPGLDSCDPGPDVAITLADSSGDLLLLPNTWGYLQAQVSGSLGPAGSRCFARTMLAGLPFARLVDPARQAELGLEIGRRTAGAYAACESVP